ncbi:MAG TPA: immune inhibitor A, partial [Anaerolineae bacterium]|nr:immune inhibitor A [Anaerolineae bacterium]
MRRSLVLLIVVALLITMVPMAVTAKPPLPEPEPEKVVRSTFSKPKDIPNPIDAARLAKREDLLLQGKTAEAAALAKTGKDNLLVILVEFGGSDTVTWNPGDMWDPIGNPDPEDYEAYGDCSGIITEATQFTYTGPLHNQLPRPPSITHRAYNSIWTEDFSTEYYHDLLFGDGVYVQYTTVDGTPVTIDLRGYSLREYYEEQSRGMYTVDGDVVGWVQVPHSEAYYGADACPGGRSAGYSGLADGYFPGGGDLPSDAIDAVAAAYPDFDWAKYDQDGDGVLDRVMFVHAGYGEEDSTALLKFSGIGEMAIWSHSSTVWPYKDIGSTGFRLGPYTMMPENGLTGVFAHE